MIPLSKNLKVEEQGENVSIVYKSPDGSRKYIAFNGDAIYVNSTQAFTDVLAAKMPLAYSSAFQTATLTGSLMPLGYSSGFQTATLASTFLPTANIAFGNVANYSFTSTVNGVSTTYYIKTA